jgi:hypothetical protein
MVLMKIAHAKINIRRPFLQKLCFAFMVCIVAIELGFGQHVAAEVLKNFYRLISAQKSRRKPWRPARM